MLADPMEKLRYSRVDAVPGSCVRQLKYVPELVPTLSSSGAISPV